MSKRPAVMVVDDDAMYLELISALLESENYQIHTANEGTQALQLLEAHGGEIQAILLDWIMPRMDGLETLRAIKKHPRTSGIPVVMQTAKTRDEDVARGIQEGAFYYLKKPYEEQLLLSVVRAAVADFNRLRELVYRMEENSNISGLMYDGSFKFRTLNDANRLSRWLANACPDPRNAILGLWELFINAVEHGNLGIDYDEKGRLLTNNTYTEEIDRRLGLPDYESKLVEVTFQRNADEIRIRIKDQGQGFDFDKFMELDPGRIFDNHGKGILMARMLYFHQLRYMGAGNEVEAMVRVEQAPGSSQATLRD